MAEEGNALYDVGKFSSKIATSGLASPNKFEVFFKSIPVEAGGAAERVQLNLMCDQVTLAGRDVQATLDIQYGIRRQIAYNAPAYTPLSLSFLCTDKMLEKTILDKWNNLIVPVQRGFHVEYYDKYIGELDVFVLDRSGKKKTYHMHYHEVYPKTVTAVELNHGTTNATLRVTASFEYSYWTTNSFGHTNAIETTGAINAPSIE